MTTARTRFEGRLKVVQRQKGYRFSVDAVILAHHIPLKGSQVMVDLGTGCGIVSLIVACRNPLARIHGIEIQKKLADVAAQNVRLNGMEDRITIIHGDMKDVGSHLVLGEADVVFSNPPYRKVQSGRLNPDEERAIAKHEISACLSDVVSAAERLLKVSGRLYVVYPADRAIDLVTRMRASGLEPKKLRWVHSVRDSKAELVVAEGVKHGRPGLRVSPPLVLTEKDGSRTREFEEMMTRY